MRHFLSALLAVVFGLLLAGDAIAEGKHLFILSGQSNMRQPLPDSFRHCVEHVFGKDQVLVVIAGWPSQPIKQWYKDWQPPPGMADEKPETNGSLYNKLLEKVQRNVGDQSLNSVTYIWMQGEADAGNGWGSVYEKSFLGVVDQIKRDLQVDRVNFVVGRINDFWLQKTDGELVRSTQQKLGEQNEHGDWIDTDDLNRGVNPWGGFSFDDGHFPPPGYRVMGQRFAQKACQLIDPKMKLDPAVFEEHFIDAIEQIESHAAVDAKVTSSHEPEGSDLAGLTDGKYGQPDHTDAAWIGLAPSEEPIEILIDLGEVKTIETIAASTLISSAGEAEFPDKITYSTSEDGESFKVDNSRYHNISFYNRKLLASLRKDSIEPETLLLLVELPQLKARYIKIEIDTAEQWVFLDEIVVNPVKK